MYTEVLKISIPIFLAVSVFMFALTKMTAVKYESVVKWVCIVGAIYISFITMRSVVSELSWRGSLSSMTLTIAMITIATAICFLLVALYFHKAATGEEE